MRAKYDNGTMALLQTGRRSGAVSYVAESGFSADEVYRARARTIDTDFNALYTAVFGSPRVAPVSPTPIGQRLGESWRRAFVDTIGRWRTDRDELSQTVIIFGSVWGPKLDEYQRDVNRFATDIRNAGGSQTPVPTPPANPPSALPDITPSINVGLGSFGVVLGVGLAAILLVSIAGKK